MNSTKNNPGFSINCKGELIDLSQPKVMGILNITPDSFYDGGRFKDSKTILKQVQKNDPQNFEQMFKMLSPGRLANVLQSPSPK